MLSRTIQSPGVEYQEIDRSNYGDGRPLVDTTVFCLGFADRGTDYSPVRSLSMKSFIDNYGYPTNENERYFFKTAQEVFTIGGELYSAKIPYENEAKDKFTWVSYKIGNTVETTIPSSLTELDSSITSFFRIVENSDEADFPFGIKEQAETDELSNRLLSMAEYDKYLVGEAKVPENTILVVNKTRNKYGKDPEIREIFPSEGDVPEEFETDSYLGIVPVLVSPVAALMYQRQIEKSFITLSCLETFSIGNGHSLRESKNFSRTKDDLTGDLSTYEPFDFEDNFTIPLAFEGTDTYSDSVEKRAVDLFPQIKFREPHLLDREFLKQIGIVIFKMVSNPSDKNKIDFIPVESFVGSLDKNAKDTVTGESLFLDKIIDDRSKYISLFSNYQNEPVKTATTIVIENQKARSLGFYEAYCKKRIDVEEMFKSIDKILDNVEDREQYPFDLVVDAGMSNIAQFVALTDESLSSRVTSKQSNYIPEDATTDEFRIDISKTRNNPTTKQWKRLLNRLDEFCRYTRKDCMFIADGLRCLCLQGNQKIVRNTNPKNTIKNSILPKVKEMIALNSSYSAGYCDWFSCIDFSSGERFWCPPSIKAMYSYLFTDRYYDRWDAPAGEKRGIVYNTYDLAFSPTEKEADTLYLNNWNYAVSYPLTGILIEGQKTFQVEKTALDRVNVRRLCLTIRRSLTRLAREFKYEGITEELIDDFRDKIDFYLNSVKSGNGISEFYLVADSRNNTPETIERNELHADFAIRPVKTTEFIIIRSVVVNQTANLEEVTNSVLF